jgi:uncharacterized protein (TIGR02246 family)
MDVPRLRQPDRRAELFAERGEFRNPCRYVQPGSSEPSPPDSHEEMSMSHDRVEDELAINAMLSEMYRAWMDNDADGFVAHYTDDATAILPGSLRGSRKVIRDMMAAGFDGPLKGSSTVDKQLSLRFVGPDGAIAVSEGGILFAGENTVPEERKIHATWVFEKRDGRWMVAAYHNSPVQAPVHA